MIKNLWNITEVVCGCHGDVNPSMTLKTGHRSMFYSCPKYYPEGREPGELACVNHLSTDDFQKILDKISSEIENSLVFGQSMSLLGLKFTVKTIDVKIISYSDEKIVIQIKNKNAIR